MFIKPILRINLNFLSVNNWKQLHFKWSFVLHCKNTPTNLKKKKKWKKNYTYVLDFAYVIPKTCSSEETQTFKKPSVSDLTEVSAPSYRTQIQPWKPLFLWPSTFPCSSLHPWKRPNAVNAPTHIKNPVQTIYLIAPAAVSRLHSTGLPWSWFKIWRLTVGTAPVESPTAIFGCSSIHVTQIAPCSFLQQHNDWWSSEGGSWEGDKPSWEPSMTYWSPSHQRMNTDLTLSKIRSELYFFSLPFLIFFTNMQHILSLAHKSMHITDIYLNKKLQQVLQTS